MQPQPPFGPPSGSPGPAGFPPAPMPFPPGQQVSHQPDGGFRPAPHPRFTAAPKALIPPIVQGLLSLLVVPVAAGGVAVQHHVFETKLNDLDYSASKSDFVVYYLAGMLPYLPLLIAVLIGGRSIGRRLSAAVLVLLAAFGDWGIFAVLYGFDSLRSIDVDTTRWIGAILAGTATVLAVMAWGVARRRGLAWVIGLLPTVLMAVGLQVLYWQDLNWTWWVGNFWLASAALNITAVLLGCLICWGIDGMGRAKRGGPPTQAPGGFASPPPMSAQPSGFGPPAAFGPPPGFGPPAGSPQGSTSPDYPRGF